MKWTKERKIAVGLLGVALAAFLGDRFVLQEGESEVAVTVGSDIKPAAGTSAGPTPSESATIAAGLPMAALARKMEEICLAEGLTPGRSGDAFTPPASWFPAPPPETASAPPPAAAPSRANEFKATYKLTAVMRSGPASRNGLAVIQGKTIRVGQSIGGFTLKSVDERSVLLSDGTEEVELVLLDGDLANLQ